MDTDADRLVMIKALGGQLVSSDLRDFWAIFDNDYQAALPDGLVEARGPALTCRTSDVQNLKRLATITVAGVPHKLNKHEPDGTGMSVLFLGR
jgi:hypothetical protein